MSGDRTRHLVERLRGRGLSPAQVIADTVLNDGVLDRQKCAIMLGLMTAGDGRTWTAAEMLHALAFARRWARMTEAEIREIFEEALRLTAPAPPMDLATSRVARLEDTAADVLDARRAREWLREANPWLEGRAPAELARESDEGLDLVLQLLERIRTGTYT